MEGILSCSILTQEFKKSEIKTVEELIQLIENSSIKPKPDCETLEYIWNWRDYISGYLSPKELQNHSFYNAFRIISENTVSEGMVTKLRCKRLPQDVEWEPPTGIRLVKANTPFDPVGSADFRVQELMLPKIMEGLQKYFKRMPTAVRVKVDGSWSRLKDRLESLPRRKVNLPKMRLNDLPKHLVEADPKLPDEFIYVEEADQDLPEIVGDIFEENLFDSNIHQDLDIVVYTECTEGRPWVGRITEVLERRKFIIRWYQRHGRSLRFHAMFNDDKTPYQSVLENQSVMMWDISVERTQNSFHLTPYKLSTILKEYKKYDQQLLDGDHV